jgi:hypothetical protein
MRTALDGRIDEAIKLVELGQRSVIRGLLIFGVSTATALMSALRSAPFELGISPVVLQITHWWVSTILSLIIGVPFIIIGLGKVRRARAILNDDIVQETSEAGRSAESDRYLTAAPLSVTETTTRELEKPSQIAKPSPE